MECLDSVRLLKAFAEGPSEERDRVEHHLDGCRMCRMLVAAYARMADDKDSDVPGRQPPAESLASVRGAAADTEAARRDAPAARGPEEHRSGDVIERRYVLERIVGEGGISVVWSARHIETGRSVALKMLKIDTPELTRRALREAHVASTIGHPNIVDIYDVIAPPDAPPILVMDLLRGESLNRLLTRRQSLPVAEALGVLVPVVSAVRAAHGRGVLHRDLKPQNIFLAREDEAQAKTVMLLDFGLAKLLDPDAEILTRTGTVIGTPHYMAPEQLYGESDIDRRADVWAIGVVSYECLTGRRPIEGTSYGRILRNASRPTTLLRDLLPGTPRDLATLIDRMLSHDRDARPEFTEVQATFDAFATPE